MVSMNGWITELAMNMIKRNPDEWECRQKQMEYCKWWWSRWGYQNECKGLINVLQNVTLGFENGEGMIGEERIIIKSIIESFEIIMTIICMRTKMDLKKYIEIYSKTGKWV